MARKMGLREFDEKTDDELTNELLDILRSVETDMTIFFRALADIDIKATGTIDTPSMLFKEAYYQPEELTEDYQRRLSAWLGKYFRRLEKDGTSHEQKKEQMNLVNPKYVLRNYLAQLAIDKAENGDNSMVYELLDVLRHPYDDQPDRDKYAAKRPEWARNRPGCSMLSCSS